MGVGAAVVSTDWVVLISLWEAPTLAKNTRSLPGIWLLSLPIPQYIVVETLGKE
jgi:hypothetical protein